jgi:hypothetical protein
MTMGHRKPDPGRPAAGQPSTGARPAATVCAVIVGDYRDFMAAIAASAASLTGLLFVALSVAPRVDPKTRPAVIQQVRAAAALLAFLNALAVSLFGLVPGTNVGFPAAILGVSGTFFSAAATRSFLASPLTTLQRRRQAGLIFLLLLIFGTELIAGIFQLTDPRRTEPREFIGYALVTSVLVGISRAWELVGDRDTGLFASIGVLIRHGSSLPLQGTAYGAAEPPPAGTAPKRPPAAQAPAAGEHGETGHGAGPDPGEPGPAAGR